MANSKAKKTRKKLEREGRRNPESKRSIYAANDMFIQMRTKTTKTKKDLLYRNKYENHTSNTNDEGSFYFGTKGHLVLLS